MHQAEGFVASLTAVFEDGSSVTHSGPRGGLNETEAETLLWNSENTMKWFQGQLDRSVLRQGATNIETIISNYEDEVANADFRDLQRMCKDADINAKGSADELRERLLAASQSD
jgi:hypothetical protein